MTKTELAYLAGIMDADGCFTIRRSTYSVRIRKEANNPTYQERVCLKQVSKDAIEIIHKHFGGYYGVQKPSTPNGKPLYSLQLTCRKAANFTKAIIPFLRIKRRQAEILLALRKSINRKREGIQETIHKNCWGKYTRFKHRCVSPEQIAFREALIAQLDQLNDIRSIKYQWRK